MSARQFLRVQLILLVLSLLALTISSGLSVAGTVLSTQYVRLYLKTSPEQLPQLDLITLLYPLAPAAILLTQGHALLAALSSAALLSHELLIRQRIRDQRQREGLVLDPPPLTGS